MQDSFTAIHKVDCSEVISFLDIVQNLTLKFLLKRVRMGYDRMGIGELGGSITS